MAKKKESPQPSIVFPEKYMVLGADLSLKRPGFCLLSVDNGTITVNQLLSVDNKTDKKKSHGQLLEEIRTAFTDLLYGKTNETIFFVRETEVLHMKVPSERNVSKVVGLMDWILWKTAQLEWQSIYPVTIKKLVAGSGKAEKSEVADGLEKYVGKQEYKCDDESDATAVAVAWLIQQGQIKELP